MTSRASNSQTSIVSSAASLPYALRSICHELHVTLRERFPDEAEDDLIKVLGNLLYYRYMNPALVAPEAFDVVDIGADAVSALFAAVLMV